MEFTLLWAALTAVGAAWLGTRVWPGGLPERPLDELITAAIVGLVAGRLAAMVVQGTNPLTNLSDFLIVRGGVLTPVASLGFIIALWAVNDRSLVRLDAFSPVVMAGLAGWHSGCLWRDACLGAASDVPWAFAGAGSSITRHPVELYAAIGLVLAAFVVSRLPASPGLRASAGLSMASLIRLATEPLRPSLTSAPAVWYAIGVVIGLLGVAAASWAAKREPT